MAGYTVSSGKAIQLITPPLGTGGEGAIFGVVGHSKVVAKIYHPQRLNRTLETKLRAMITNPPDDATRLPPLNHVSITWPTDLVFKNGQFCGYIMPKLPKSDDLYLLLQPQQRKTNHPTLNHQHLYRSARNLAIAVDAIHQKGYVIGDVNFKNALFNDKSLITIVDCDSMQVTDAQGVIHRCLVGVPEYTPTELQNQDFNRINRTPSHDTFGLAILIFQLLMQGFHPFQGRSTSQQTQDISQLHVYCIANNIFPYNPNQQLFIPPKVAPAFDCIPGILRTLFMRAFTQSHNRPTAKEWETVLGEIEKRLIVCAKDNTHIHPSDGKCVICDVNSKTQKGPNSMQTTGIQVPLPQPTVRHPSPRTTAPQATSPSATAPNPTSIPQKRNYWYLIILGVLALIIINQVNTFQTNIAAQQNVDYAGDASVSMDIDQVEYTSLNPDVYPNLRITHTGDSSCFLAEIQGDDAVDVSSWIIGNGNLDPNSSDFIRFTPTFVNPDRITFEICDLSLLQNSDGSYTIDVIDSDYRPVVRITSPTIGVSIKIFLNPNKSTPSNQELTLTQVAKQSTQITNTETNATANAEKPASSPQQAQLAITLDPGNGRDDKNCVSMNITGIDVLYWRMTLRGAPFEPAVFDAAGNARVCNEWIGQQPGFYVDIVNANFEPVPNGSTPAVGGDIFKSRWVNP
jgi:hypothetical protein